MYGEEAGYTLAAAKQLDGEDVMTSEMKVDPGAATVGERPAKPQAADFHRRRLRHSGTRPKRGPPPTQRRKA